jgi:hypothetical protein
VVAPVAVHRFAVPGPVKVNPTRDEEGCATEKVFVTVNTGLPEKVIITPYWPYVVLCSVFIVNEDVKVILTAEFEI